MSASLLSRSATQPLASDYWFRARRPLAGLVFLMPLMLAYEAGVSLFGARDPAALRNGADYWMRDWLSLCGLSHPLLLPVLVVAVLLVWHFAAAEPWSVGVDTLVGMLAESIAFACCLIALGQIHGQLCSTLPELRDLAIASATGPRVVAFLGAGVYEEVLFRLLLVPAIYGALRVLECPRKPAGVLAVAGSSLLFAMAHYVGPAADQFSAVTFSFRALAGGFFASLFLLRGFGITVGTHAAYDLMVGVLLANPA